MNYLAHILLAPDDSEAQLGALLGDFVKVPSVETYGPTMNREILLHRKIDSFTDSHALVLAQKALFRRETRRFAGILLDVYYDHLLARDWANFCARPLHEFVQRFYAGAANFRAVFPHDFSYAFDRMVADNWLESYREFAGVEQALRRIGKRVPKFAGPLSEGLVDLSTNERDISRTFPEFFASLMRFAGEKRSDMSAGEVR